MRKKIKNLKGAASQKKDIIVRLEQRKRHLGWKKKDNTANQNKEKV